MINIDACVKYAQNTAEDLKSSVEYEANWCIRHNLKRCPDHFERFLVENKLAKEPVSFSELIAIFDAI